MLLLNGNAKTRYVVFYIVVSIVFVLFTTILIRTPTLSSTARLSPFWSYIGKGYHKQIVLNIALFVPLGFFISAALPLRRILTMLIAMSISTCVELIQFITCRGMLDVDDVISNVIGAAIGLLLYGLIGGKNIVCFILIFAEVVGCMFAFAISFDYSKDVRVTEQFDFDISAVQRDEGNIQINGRCVLNNRNDLPYQIILAGSEETYTTETTINDKTFTAKAENVVDETVEIQIKFKGHGPMPTKTWVNGSEVKFVPIGDMPKDIIDIGGVLKAYSKEYNTFVLQNGQRLIWLIGWDIDDSTEIIYHVYTNEPEKLSEARALYGYENKGFRATKVDAQDQIGNYIVFEKSIPSDYYVTAVVVGFKTDGKITWTDSFRVIH